MATKTTSSNISGIPINQIVCLPKKLQIDKEFFNIFSMFCSDKSFFDPCVIKNHADWQK